MRKRVLHKSRLYQYSGACWNSEEEEALISKRVLIKVNKGREIEP